MAFHRAKNGESSEDREVIQRARGLSAKGQIPMSHVSQNLEKLEILVAEANKVALVLDRLLDGGDLRHILYLHSFQAVRAWSG